MPVFCQLSSHSVSLHYSSRVVLVFCTSPPLCPRSSESSFSCYLLSNSLKRFLRLHFFPCIKILNGRSVPINAHFLWPEIWVRLIASQTEVLSGLDTSRVLHPGWIVFSYFSRTWFALQSCQRCMPSCLWLHSIKILTRREMLRCSNSGRASAKLAAVYHLACDQLMSKRIPAKLWWQRGLLPISYAYNICLFSEVCT